METERDLTWDEFQRVEMRVGTIVSAEVFHEARNPAYKLVIDFGEYGIKKTSAQITVNYNTDDVVGKQVVAVINFPDKQIANIKSECLLLGAEEGKAVTLLSLDKPVPNGLRIA